MWVNKIWHLFSFISIHLYSLRIFLFLIIILGIRPYQNLIKKILVIFYMQIYVWNFKLWNLNTMKRYKLFYDIFLCYRIDFSYFYFSQRENNILNYLYRMLTECIIKIFLILVQNWFLIKQSWIFFSNSLCVVRGNKIKKRLNLEFDCYIYLLFYLMRLLNIGNRCL